MSLRPSPVKRYIRLNNRSIKPTKTRRKILSYDPDGKVLMLGAGDESTNGLPHGLYLAVKKAIDLVKHLETHENDENAKFDLQLVEIDIGIMARYYKSGNLLPSDWKYERATAR